MTEFWKLSPVCLCTRYHWAGGAIIVSAESQWSPSVFGGWKSSNGETRKFISPEAVSLRSILIIQFSEFFPQAFCFYFHSLTKCRYKILLWCGLGAKI